MKTPAGTRWTRRLERWLAILVLCCGGSSCISWKTQGYPAALGASLEPNVVIWPTDASGAKFSSIAIAATSTVTEDDRIVSFEWPGDLARALPASIGSVSVLLDPNPSVELRACVNELLSNIEREHPSVITSVTVCVEPLGQIADGKSFVEAVTRLAQAAMDERMRLVLAPVAELDDFSFGSFQREPTRIVLPNAAVPGEFFVVRGDGVTLLPLAEDREAEIQNYADANALTDLMDGDFVLFIDPWSTPFEVEISMGELMQRATPQPKSGEYATSRWTSWPVQYDEITSPEAVRRLLRGRFAGHDSPAKESDSSP